MGEELIRLNSSEFKNPTSEARFRTIHGAEESSGVNSSLAGAAGQVVGKKLDSTPQSSKTPPLVDLNQEASLIVALFYNLCVRQFM